jgi:hypothetical protein
MRVRRAVSPDGAGYGIMRVSDYRSVLSGDGYEKRSA